MAARSTPWPGPALCPVSPFLFLFLLPLFISLLPSCFLFSPLVSLFFCRLGLVPSPCWLWCVDLLDVHAHTVHPLLLLKAESPSYKSWAIEVQVPEAGFLGEISQTFGSERKSKAILTQRSSCSFSGREICDSGSDVFFVSCV